MGFLFDSLLRLFSSSSIQRSSAMFTWKKTILKININGNEQVLDASSGLSESLMNQMANQLGMNIPELHDLLNISRTQQGVNLRQNSTQTTGQPHVVQQRKGPLRMIRCPKCNHEIAEADWCWYCGYAFDKKTITPTTNDIDEKFLKNDVEVKEKASEQNQQKLRDTYKDRLEGL